MHATPRATPSASALQAAHAHNHRDPAVVDLLLQLEIVTTEKVEVQVCTSLARTRTLAHARTHAAPGRSAAPVTALALAPLPRAVRTHARTAFRATRPRGRGGCSQSSRSGTRPAHAHSCNAEQLVAALAAAVRMRRCTRFLQRGRVRPRMAAAGASA
jgi:hypothetical protein